MFKGSCYSVLVRSLAVRLTALFLHSVVVILLEQINDDDDEEVFGGAGRGQGNNRFRF